MEEEIHPFILHGVREVMPSEAIHLERTVNAIEQALSENHGLAFDLSKSLIETTCKTIIKDRGHEYVGNEDLQKLIKVALGLVCTIPEDIEEPVRAKDSLIKTINGLTTSVIGICELRNLFGEASHGRDAYFSQIENDHALMVARSADAIVSYLFRLHRAFPARHSETRLSYKSYIEFNDWIDEQNDAVRIFELEYKPSEVLFHIDRVAYRDLLSGYESDGSPEEIPAENNAQGSNDDE